MIYKIACAGDLHKRNKDISTITGYVKCCDAVQESLMEFFKSQNITHFISLGDWYDKGFVDDVSAALCDTSMEYYMYEMLNGNFYGVIGNHIRLRLDSNPELFLIQPHPVYKMRKPIKRDYPIIKTPSYFMVGNVQFSLVHHLDEIESVEDYKICRLPQADYHVAIVHDPLFIPNEKLQLTNIPSTRSLNTQISRTLSNVDLCICGDIHTPLGMFDISAKTKMYVPGSLTNTNAGERGNHGSINIPIITVDDEKGTYSFGYYPFNLKTNMVSFNRKVEQSVGEKLKSIRGNNVEKMYDNSCDSYLSSGISSLSYGAFLRDQKYTEADKSLIKTTIRSPEEIYELVKIHMNDGAVPEEV